jgi:hypothetical protein
MRRVYVLAWNKASVGFHLYHFDYTVEYNEFEQNSWRWVARLSRLLWPQTTNVKTEE